MNTHTPNTKCFGKSFPFQTIIFIHKIISETLLDFNPWWLRWQSICLRCRRPRFDPWVGKIPWRRKWQSTPVLLPGKSHGQRSLVGYSPWGRKESDTTERLHFPFTLNILWHCFSLGLEWKLTFSSPVATAEFSIFASILSAALSQCHLLGFEKPQLEFHHLH